ncbi:hypothetical protein MBLNU457_7396t3 [Dothideomycetes sp. NU457]
MHTSVTAFVALILLLRSPAQGFLQKRLDNGLAKTPPMGWNSYNHYSCQPNQSIVQSNAKALVDFGLADLGYHYVTTDCGWTTPDRNADGTLTWNTTLFPDGFPATGVYIHNLGLGFGVYSDAGIWMCATPDNSNQTGSLGHEMTDADTISSWGADLLKYDNCYSSADHGYPDADYDPTSSPANRYQTMKAALNDTGRPILYQICEWGLDFPSNWAPPLGNTWRITNDIIPAWRTIYRMINQAVPSASYAGPSHWPDLDMLEVGNNVFTIPEEQTHFSLWAIMKSPLVIGAALNDSITTINPDSLAVLSNKDAISYNQDSLGISANITRRWSEAGIDTWAGPLSGNRTVVAVVNWNNNTVEATLDLSDVGLQSAGYIKDVWNNATTYDVQTSYVGSIPAHGTLLLELGDTMPSGYYAADQCGKRQGLSTTFTNVYGVTSSSSYTLTLSLDQACKRASTISIATSATKQTTTHTISRGSTTVSIPVTLLASNNNTLTITSSDPSISVTTVHITPPAGTFYPATSFGTNGTAAHIPCDPGLCAPVGAKIGYLSPNGSASLRIPSPPSTIPGPKFLELTYINNEVATSTSWTNGRNARNITVSVNVSPATRLEVPLSGRSSELFGPMLGWGDSAVLGLLVDGFGVGNEENVITVGNVGGELGVDAAGADFVGRTEEEIVIAYVKEQSLLEMQHSKKGKGRAASIEDEDDEELQKALEMSLLDHRA